MKKIAIAILVMAFGSGCMVYSEPQEGGTQTTYVKKLVCDSLPQADGSLRCHYEFVPAPATSVERPRNNVQVVLPPAYPVYQQPYWSGWNYYYYRYYHPYYRW